MEKRLDIQVRHMADTFNSISLAPGMRYYAAWPSI